MIDIKLKKCEIELFLRSFFIVYCPDKQITLQICYKAVDEFLAALKLVPDWFVTSKMIKKYFTTL